MFQEFFRHGRCSQGDIGESWNQVRQAVSAIEAIFEFRQIALRIFRIKRVIAAAQGCLEIAQYRIDPVKLRFLHCGTTATADDRLMRTSCLCDGIETFQTVRDHMTASGQMLLGPTGDFWFAKAPDHGELDPLRMALIIGLHGGHKRRLATGAASALAATSLTTQIGVIHLHQTRQTLFLTALEHHLHQLVLHPPGRIVGDAQLSMQLYRRDAFLGLGQKVDRLKPDRQRQFAGFKDGAGDDRRLSMTPIALTQFAGVEVTAFIMAAVGTEEAI